jgi:hypothetical protein
MLQWIAALERVARESHYTGKNRFDSFAPIRLNVAAQWLVDGVGVQRIPQYDVLTCSLARLLLESFSRHSTRQGVHLHS